LRPRVSAGTSLRWIVAGVRVGSAAFSVAIILMSPESLLILGLLGISLLVIGGASWMKGHPRASAVRLLIVLGVVVLVRLAFGTLGALFAAVFLALGAWLRVRLADAITGLAVFGLLIAFLGAASARVMVFFAAIGLASLILRHVAADLWRRISAWRSLRPERVEPPALGAEN
jgi:hypothetical protein